MKDLKDLLAKLGELIDAVNNLAKGGFRRKWLSTTFSEKVIIKHKGGTEDFIVSVGVGKEFPFDLGGKETMAEFRNLTKTTRMLVEKFGDEVIDSIKKKIEEDN